jgi:hypothetical protein
LNNLSLPQRGTNINDVFVAEWGRMALPLIEAFANISITLTFLHADHFHSKYLGRKRFDMSCSIFLNSRGREHTGSIGTGAAGPLKAASG